MDIGSQSKISQKRKVQLVIFAFLLLFVSLAISLSLIFLEAEEYKVQIDFSHTQIYPQTKVGLIDYMGSGSTSPYQNPVVRQFVANHYDIIFGGKDYAAEGGTAPVFPYTNYYCMYVKSPTDDLANINNEYVRAMNWAKSHNVNFEDFFIHYKAGTSVSFKYDTDKSTYTLPTSDCVANATTLGYPDPERTCRRVPTYGWYGTKADLSKPGARVIMNVGNSNYRAWKLDELAISFFSKTYIKGVFIDNSPINNNVGTKYPENQTGSTDFEEYARDNGETSPIDGDAELTAGEKYSNDLVVMFSEFAIRFPDKGQVPNVAQYDDYAYSSNISPMPELNAKIYPYVYGFSREALLQSSRNLASALGNAPKNLERSEQAGLKVNFIGSVTYGGESPDPIDRNVMPGLAEYYLIKNSTTAIFPFLQYVADRWDVDPRTNQWFEAVAYNVGQPRNDASDSAYPSRKFRTLSAGINPASVNKTTMNAQTVEKVGYSYRLTDPNANWALEQWTNKKIVFPDNRLKSVYHNGSNWIDLYWSGSETPPPVGTYQIGDNDYVVYWREYDNAIAIYKPMDTRQLKDSTTAVTETLPITSNNPQGEYYQLKPDGTLDATPIKTVSLRNSDGGVFIKAMSLSLPTLSISVDKTQANVRDQITYTYRYSNPGAQSVTDVRLEANVPAGTSFISATNNGATQAGKVVWNIGILEASAQNVESSLTVKINDSASGSVVGNATLFFGDQNQTVLSNEVTTTINQVSNPITVNIKINGQEGPIFINSGVSGNLTWVSEGATSCTASGDWEGTKPLSGTESIESITSAKTYTLTCANDQNQTAQDSVVVNINSVGGGDDNGNIPGVVKKISDAVKAAPTGIKISIAFVFLATILALLSIIYLKKNREIE